MPKKETLPPEWSRNLDIELLKIKTELEWIKTKKRLQKTLERKS